MARPEAKIDLAELEKLCGMQCTDEEVAAFFGVSTRTIERRREMTQNIFPTPICQLTLANYNRYTVMVQLQHTFSIRTCFVQCPVGIIKHMLKESEIVFVLTNCQAANHCIADVTFEWSLAGDIR